MSSETNSEQEFAETDPCSFYKFTREDIDAVNPINWHETFKNVTPKTHICPIPPEVLKYLKSDGMVMPQNTHTTPHLNLASVTGANAAAAGARGVNKEGDEEDDDDDDNVSWASISSSEEKPSIPSEFLQNIGREQRRAPLRAGGNGNGASNIGANVVAEEEVWETQSDSSSSSDEDNTSVPSRKKLAEVEKFHEYDILLDEYIKKLGGAVLPKINRKSPKDANWIGFNRSLKCYNAGDIYLLLKTSDVVSQVLENPYQGCYVHDDAHGAASASSTSTAPYLLVMKQWNDTWGPEMEFRCFICANQLIAICQRDLDTCHSAIIKRKDKLLLNIQNFFIQNVQGCFPLEYYVMDLVCHPNGDIYIVDFDVYGTVTDPLLFTYRELQSIYEGMAKELTSEDISSKWDENQVSDFFAAGEATGNDRSVPKFPRFGSPCLRFLTESRTFRGRKTGNHSELANDVMTYIRESVSKK